ncbi:MAG: transglycosylase SLT domain-containing protein [Pelagimonas sp.]
MLLVAILATCLSVPVSGLAQSAFPDFSAKRVKPPKPGEGPRITVQIAPRANPAVLPPPSTQTTPAVTPTPSGQVAPSSHPDARYGWYWQAVSPKIEDAGPGRLEAALIALSNGPQGQAVAAPRLQHLQDIASAHGRSLLIETVGTNISPALALAVMAIESSGRADAVSKAGAQGLMQLMPATAARFGVEDALDAQQNIRGGVAFLNFLHEKFEGDPILMLAGYNAGENSIGKHDGVPAFVETRDYVPKVLAAFQVAKGLCLTPPELISDGCVFRVQ